MEHIVRPRGFSVEQHDLPDGRTVTTLVYRDEGGDTVRVGGFGPEQWEKYQAIIADPAAAIAAELAAAESAAIRAQIVKPD